MTNWLRMITQRHLAACLVAALFFVDQIEADVAVLIPASYPNAPVVHRFPVALLPHGTREGSWVTLSSDAASPPAQASHSTTPPRKTLSQGDDGGDLRL